MAANHPMEFTAPLTPVDCDLRDFQYMELDVRQLRDSRFAAQVTGDGFRAGVLLWAASWHQVPAASLPDDDIELANLAGYGRFIKEWKKVREEALYGFVKCSDGRLYHPTIAAKASAAWQSRLEYAYNKLLDRLRKENKKRTAEGSPIVGIPTFEQWNSGAYPNGIPPERPNVSGGNPAESGSGSSGKEPENPLKGRGNGEGEGKGDYLIPPAPTRATPRRLSDDPESFAMHDDWLPSDSFPAAMLRGGLPETLLTPESLTEFVIYRKSTGEALTQAEWDHKLFQRLTTLKSTPQKPGGSHASKPASANTAGNPGRVSPFQRATLANGASGQQPAGAVIDGDFERAE